MNQLIAYYVTNDGKVWITIFSLEEAINGAERIKGQVFLWKDCKELILVYSHGERALKLV